MIARQPRESRQQVSLEVALPNLSICVQCWEEVRILSICVQCREEVRTLSICVQCWDPKYLCTV